MRRLALWLIVLCCCATPNGGTCCADVYICSGFVPGCLCSSGYRPMCGESEAP